VEHDALALLALKASPMTSEMPRRMSWSSDHLMNTKSPIARLEVIIIFNFQPINTVN